MVSPIEKNNKKACFLFIFRSEKREETEKPPLKPNGSAGVQQWLEKKNKKHNKKNI